MPSKKAKPKVEMPRKLNGWVNESHRDPNASVLQQKKQTIIHDCDATDGVHIEHTEAGTVVFDQGMAVLPNDGRADEIMAELKGRKGNHRSRYAYVKDREGMRRDPLHKMRIQTVALPWNKYDEFGRKIDE